MSDLALFGGDAVRRTPWPSPRMLTVESPVVEDVQRVLSEGLTLFTSPRIRDLEHKLAGTFAKQFAVAISSGTASLETALHAIGIRAPNDEVIVPAATYISTATAVLRCGGKPIFVDCDDSYTMAVDEVRKAIGPQTKAIIFVSLFGNPGTIDDIAALCNAAGVPLIHDCAQGAATMRDGRWIASLGDVVCLSFYETKHLPGGEGGALLTDREDIYREAKSFMNLCETREDGTPTAIEPNFRLSVVYPHLGTNYRLCALTAVLVAHALDRLTDTKERCRATGERYRASVGRWGIFPRVRPGDEIGWYGIPIRLARSGVRDGVWKALHSEGTPVARYYYTCLPHNPVFAHSERTYPVTESLVSDALVLPTHLAIGTSEVADLTEAFAKVCGILCAPA